jgi:hypothetical protein
MSGADHASTSHTEPTHDGGGQGHDDGHGNGHGHEEALGPIDWRAWGAAVVGLIGGLLVIVALYATINQA